MSHHKHEGKRLSGYLLDTTLAYLQFEGELRLVAAAYYAGEKQIGKQGLGCADADIYRYVCEVQRFYRKRQMVARTTARNSTKGAEHP